MRISIVLPNHNHASFLPTSLGALAEQTEEPYEIIVVDDGSTDDSLSIINSFRPRLQSMKVVALNNQIGVAAAVQRGIETASGDFVFLASADDRIDPNACAFYHQAVATFSQAKLVISKFTEWWPEDDRKLVHGPDSDLGMWYHDGNDPAYFTTNELECLMRERYVGLAANTACISRKELVEVGGFDAGLKWHADWFAIYAIAFRHGFCAIPRSLAQNRVVFASYSRQGMRDRRAQREVSLGIQSKLNTPEFRDFDAAVMRAPNAMSTFMRPTLTALALRPARYGRLARLLLWWMGQVANGKRPGALATLVRRLRRGR